MTAELIKYAAEQSGGVLIAIILINHVENKLDILTSEVTRLTDTIAAQMSGKNAIEKIAKARK